jgi:hypothetical protein
MTKICDIFVTFLSQLLLSQYLASERPYGFQNIHPHIILKCGINKLK